MQNKTLVVPNTITQHKILTTSITQPIPKQQSQYISPTILQYKVISNLEEILKKYSLNSIKRNALKTKSYIF